MMKRRECRETALELIFEGSFHSFVDPQLIYQTAMDVRGFEDDEYVKKLFFGVAQNYSELDAVIAENAKGWKVERLSRLVLSVLRLAIYEMKYCDIAFNIVINEAVELCKEYDFESSPAFVNGVLNSVAVKEGLKA